MSSYGFGRGPVCEVCHKEPANRFSCFTKEFSDWRFVGGCSAEKEFYYVPFPDFFSSPTHTVKWLAQLHEKGTMKWDDFMDMMDRFRDEIQRP